MAIWSPGGQKAERLMPRLISSPLLVRGSRSLGAESSRPAGIDLCRLI